MTFRQSWLTRDRPQESLLYMMRFSWVIDLETKFIAVIELIVFASTSTNRRFPLVARAVDFEEKYDTNIGIKTKNDNATVVN